MERKSYFLNKKQILFLKNLQGTASEHVRRALDDYEEKLKGQSVASKSKRGESL